jgi:wobble nucleotide-excising tRNase
MGSAAEGLSAVHPTVQGYFYDWEGWVAMLERVVAIKNIGRFRNSTTTPNPSFVKHTLIFGANAYGKTTFCAVIRSVQSGNVAPLLGRQTLGASAIPNVHLLFTEGNRRLQDGMWSEIVPQISVFDGVFVSENVHSGDVVDVLHRRNLFRVTVGRAGVALAEEEQRLAEESRRKQGELTTAERAVQSFLPQGMRLSSFITLQPDPDIDTKISAQQHRIEGLRQADAIHTRAALSFLSISWTHDELEPLLTKSIEGIAADAEARLLAHLERHQMSEGGQQWIAEGVEYIIDDQCPFCGQSGLKTLPLVQAYQALFSDLYRGLQSEIGQALRAVDDDLGERTRGTARTLEATNGANIEFWGRYCQIDPATFPSLDGALADLRRAHDLLSAVLRRKARSLLEPIIQPLELQEVKGLLDGVRVVVATYNTSVTAANASIQALKEATAAGNLAAAQTELTRLQAIKRRYEPSAAGACFACEQLDREKQDIERRKEAVRSQLEDHTGRVVQPYENRINYFLDLFNADFKIARTGHGYPGGIATSSYQLVINATHIDLGGSNTAERSASFKNTLSSGDRSTLALAFFLAQLEREADLADRIVVFDDPFSSQDAFRRRQTVYEIMRAANHCNQVIVLSHDPQFLKQLWEKFPNNERTAIQILYHPTTGSKLCAFDLDDACRGRAAVELDDLLAFRATGAGNLREIIKKLRVVLETHFRFTYRGAFLADDNLGEILRKIRLGGDEHPAHDFYETLDRVNDYTADYHHGEDARGAPEPPLDQTELLGFVNITLKVVNALPS